MITPRVFSSSAFFQPTDEEPIRSVITQSKDTAVVAWYIKPGQRIPLHVHPQGQDTWTILSGKGFYCLDDKGTTEPIMEGDIVVAHSGEVHGVYNSDQEPLIFISVVSPADAGYQIIQGEGSVQVQ